MAPEAMTQEAIRWPAQFDPGRSPVHVVNSLEVAAPPSAIWSRLIRAVDWPSWYANSSGVRIEGGGQDLDAGARFRWRTFGVDLESRVEEFVPQERIAWVAKGLGVLAYHAWLITPVAGGTRVLTEETQHGFLARAARVVFPGRMERWHQRWLEGLAEGRRTPAEVA